MAQTVRTVKELARESGADVDDVLVTLWDIGLSDIMGPNDVVSRLHINQARRALGVATRNEIRSLDYWRMLLGLSESELGSLLQRLGFPVSHHARRVPQGAVSKLKVEARSRGIDPLTGRIGVSSSASLPASGDFPPAGNNLRQVAVPLVWRTPGHVRPLRLLSEEEARTIHFALVQDFKKSDDPMEPPGVRSADLLASAVFRPHTSLDNVLKYPTVETSAAALLHALILDHPFHNGNKRTALVSMLVMLDANGLFLICDQDELFKLVLQIAQHRIAELYPQDLADREVLSIADWICERSRLVEKGERPMTWRKLRRILREYGCEMEYPAGGSRINITRQIIEHGFFGRTKVEILQTQVFHGDEGRDVKVNTIKKIREDLHLDDIHNIDSHSFYGNERTEPADFIAKYRKTLSRLARL